MGIRINLSDRKKYELIEHNLIIAWGMEYLLCKHVQFIKMKRNSFCLTTTEIVSQDSLSLLINCPINMRSLYTVIF